MIYFVLMFFALFVGFFVVVWQRNRAMTENATLRWRLEEAYEINCEMRACLHRYSRIAEADLMQRTPPPPVSGLSPNCGEKVKY